MVHSLRNRKICTTSPESNDTSSSSTHLLSDFSGYTSDESSNNASPRSEDNGSIEELSFHQDMNSMNLLHSTLETVQNEPPRSPMLLNKSRLEHHSVLPVVLEEEYEDEGHPTSDYSSTHSHADDRHDLSLDTSQFVLNPASMFQTPNSASSPVRRDPDENNSTSSDDRSPSSLMLNLSACIDDIIFEQTYRRRSGVSVQMIKKQLSEKFCYDVHLRRNLINTYINEGISAKKLVQTSGHGASGSVRLVKNYHEQFLRVKRKLDSFHSETRHLSRISRKSVAHKSYSFVWSANVSRVVLSLMENISDPRINQCRRQIEKRLKMGERRAYSTSTFVIPSNSTTLTLSQVY